MPRYLSPEWLHALAGAIGEAESLKRASAGVSLVVQQVVTGGPEGDVSYHVTVDDGRVAVLAGESGEPTVTFTQDYETAAAVAQGELSAQGAFMTGRIRVRGDLPRLMECQSVFGGVDDATRSLRRVTEY